MIAALAAGLVAGYGVALPVGPVGTYLVSLGSRAGLPVAAAAALGVATTDGVYAVVAALGGRRLQSLLRPVADPLTYASAGVLVLLAARVLWTSVRRYRAGDGSAATRDARLGPLRAYAALAGVTALNPSTVAYFSALVLGDRSGTIGASTLTAGLFAAGALLASASWQLLLAGGGVLVGHRLTRPRSQLLVAVTSAAIMVLLALRLLAA